jgi:hypothetical protein
MDRIYNYSIFDADNSDRAAADSGDDTQGGNTNP